MTTCTHPISLTPHSLTCSEFTAGSGTSATRDAALEMLGGLESLMEHLGQREGTQTNEQQHPSRWPSKLRIPLGQMFDYTSPFWDTYMADKRTNTLDKELELWDILDMDADGEDDIQIDQFAAEVVA